MRALIYDPDGEVDMNHNRIQVTHITIKPSFLLHTLIFSHSLSLLSRFSIRSSSSCCFGFKFTPHTVSFSNFPFSLFSIQSNSDSIFFNSRFHSSRTVPILNSHSFHNFRFQKPACNCVTLIIIVAMENLNPPEVLGSKGLVKKQEFVRIIVQCLYSLGYTKSASCLELESGVSYKSKEFQLLESYILNGNWDECAGFLDSIRDMLGESVEPALFLVFRQCVMEYLKKGEDTLALDVLRKRVSVLRVDRCKIHGLAKTLLGVVDDGDVGCDLRGRLLMDLEKLLPPPIALPGGRLEHLVETTVTAWVDSCLFHTSVNPVSLYEDHHCGREQFPTTTTQVSWLCRLIPFFR